MTKKINYIESNKELAINLRRARENAELTQSSVRSAIGLNRSCLTYYELGRSTPTIFTLIKLSMVYNVTIEELLLKH